MLLPAGLLGSKTMKILKFLALCILVVAGMLLIMLYEEDIPIDVVDAKYANTFSQFLTLADDSRIHYRDEGTRHGEPIVLVHGFGASLHAWMPWVELLGDRFRVVTLDLPAHGLTGAIPSGDYSTRRYVETIDLLTNHLGLTSFTLGGSSMGGTVAYHYAVAHPRKSKSDDPGGRRRH